MLGELLIVICYVSNTYIMAGMIPEAFSTQTSLEHFIWKCLYYIN